MLSQYCVKLWIHLWFKPLLENTQTTEYLNLNLVIYTVCCHFVFQFIHLPSSTIPTGVAMVTVREGQS